MNQTLQKEAMNYAEWEKKVPQSIRKDSLWKMTAYRLALFIGDLGWYDMRKLLKQRGMVGISDQLYRALGSVGANLCGRVFTRDWQRPRTILRVRLRFGSRKP